MDQSKWLSLAKKKPDLSGAATNKIGTGFKLDGALKAKGPSEAMSMSMSKLFGSWCDPKISSMHPEHIRTMLKVLSVFMAITQSITTGGDGEDEMSRNIDMLDALIGTEDYLLCKSVLGDFMQGMSEEGMFNVL